MEQQSILNYENKLSDQTEITIEPNSGDDCISNGSENLNLQSNDSTSYNIECEEEIFYDLPKDNGGAELDSLFRDLEQEEIVLGEDEDLPILFDHPENTPSYRRISELKTAAEDQPINDYRIRFDDDVRDEVLLVGDISLEEVQEEEKRLREEHLRYLEQEAEREQKQKQRVMSAQESAKRRLAIEMKKQRTDLHQRLVILQQRERILKNNLSRAYKRAENQLVSALEKRKGEVKKIYGDLMMTDGQFAGGQSRRWRVDWNKAPQPVQIKLKCLRGVKDKLPGGRYVLMVSLYSRLSGHLMRWSNLKGQQWGGATLPMKHDGFFYNSEIKINQSLFTVLPSKPDLRPGMVLVFELFLLRGAVVSTDRVVGWAVFPITSGDFDVIEGKYKCPMLRGEVDYLIDKHEKIEGLIASDLDHWLSNLYFEIVKLPRYLQGQKEFEVELLFSSSLLGYPERVDTGGEEYRDGDVPIASSTDFLTVTSLDSLSVAQRSHRDSESVSKLSIADSINSQQHGMKKRTSSTDDSEISLRKRRPFSASNSGESTFEDRLQVFDDQERNEMIAKNNNENFYPVRGEKGLWYKKYTQNHADKYYKKMFSLVPKTELLTKTDPKKKMTYLEELEEHTFSVKEPFEDKGHIAQQSSKKMTYIGRQFLAEVGLSHWRSREFWGMILMFILTFFIRLFLHYVGQWLFLQALQIPINKFDFLPYTVNLNYQSTLLRTEAEFTVVLFGPLINIVFFLTLIVTSWLSQKILGLFPDICSKFVLAYGVMTFLDPILILIVDMALLRYQNLGGDIPIADCAKMYWHYQRTEGSGIAGIFITVFVYFFIMFFTGSLLYMYFLRLHNNGRMLDIYWRLHGLEEVFFCPYDLEISNQELSYIIKKSEQWRGEEGERQKTAVYDYIWEEETIMEKVWDDKTNEERTRKKDGKTEVTTHVSIHTLHLDGLRELHRHFLKLPDGAIVEVFGDINVAVGMNKDMKKALDATMSDTSKIDVDVLKRAPSLDSLGNERSK